LEAKLHGMGGRGKTVNLLQALPEFGQLFLMGTGLFVIGIVVRRSLMNSRVRVSLAIKAETKQT
jgi:hypothetical protein